MRGGILDNYIKSIADSILFKDIELNKVEEILNKIDYNVKSYEKNNMIAFEGDNCTSLGIILDGEIEVQKAFPSGKIVTINHFFPGNVFGEAILFSNSHRYPATIISSSDSQIMYIRKEVIIEIMTIDRRTIDNFMGLLSNRILMLNDRITNLSLDTLRKKISNIILSESRRQNSLKIVLPYNRKRMAKLLSIPRPSLSRELINMEDDGLISFNKNNIDIIDLEKLEETLL